MGDALIRVLTTHTLSVPREGESIYGSPNRPARPDYRINPETGCWDWLKTTCKRGYALGGPKYGIYRPYRIYFYLATGINPNGQHVHHTCKNVGCVNPDHLEVRHEDDHFYEHGVERRVLTFDQAVELREMAKDPDLSLRDLAAHYGVSVQNVHDILHAKRWPEFNGVIVRPEGRLCAYCGGEVPPERNRGAKYCRESCRTRAGWRRKSPEEKAAHAAYQRNYRRQKREKEGTGA